jgi:hypothetical protein
MVIVMALVKFLFAFAYKDVGGHIAQAFMLLLGGIILLVVPAYFIGMLVDKFKNEENNIVSDVKQASPKVVVPDTIKLNYNDTLPDQDKVSVNFMPKSDNSKPVVTNKITDDFYAQAWDEINDQNKTPDKALWAKSFSIAQGDEKKAQAKYIELRVAQLQEIANREQRQREIAIQEEKQAIIKAKIESIKREERLKEYKHIEGQKGEALCIVCSKISSINGMFHHKPTDTHYHKYCLPEEVRCYYENTLKSKTFSNDEWEIRTLCGDGKCIGIIGSDGRCKECGKTLEETKIDNKDKSPYDADDPIDLSNRVLCSDGSCIGIMGPNGRCTKCRRLLG